MGRRLSGSHQSSGQVGGSADPIGAQQDVADRSFPGFPLAPAKPCLVKRYLLPDPRSSSLGGMKALGAEAWEFKLVPYHHRAPSRRAGNG